MLASLIRKFHTNSCYKYLSYKHMTRHVIVIVCVPFHLILLVSMFFVNIFYTRNVPLNSHKFYFPLKLFCISYYTHCLFCHLFNVRCKIYFLFHLILHWMLTYLLWEKFAYKHVWFGRLWFVLFLNLQIEGHYVCLSFTYALDVNFLWNCLSNLRIFHKQMFDVHLHKKCNLQIKKAFLVRHVSFYDFNPQFKS
jgi:hypothetical protein